VPPPHADDMVEWPDAFGTRFTVMIDTEEEFDWRAPLSSANRSVTAIAALPETHRRFADSGVPLTYLIDHPVATDPAALEILRRLIEDGRSAVGTQLHPWVNPPFDEDVVPRNTFVGNLPATLEAAKLDILTDAITTGLGVRPRIYRAGRYGIGPATLPLLYDRGYRVDSSMRSAYDYSAEAGPDFAAVPNHAFRCGPGRAMIELPLTTVFTGLVRSGGAPLYRALGRIPRGRGLFARTHLMSRVALTPEDMPVADALEATAVALGQGVRLLNFAFHSPSLVPGNTPYVRDETDLKRFRHWWDIILSDLARRGVRPASLDDLIQASSKA
jgi:hypothetical protein